MLIFQAIDYKCAHLNRNKVNIKVKMKKKIVQYVSYLLQYIFWNLNKPIQWKIVYPYSHGRQNKLVQAHGSMKAMAEEPKKNIWTKNSSKIVKKKDERHTINMEWDIQAGSTEDGDSHTRIDVG